MVYLASVFTLIWSFYVVRGLNYKTLPDVKFIREIQIRLQRAKEIRLIALGKDEDSQSKQSQAGRKRKGKPKKKKQPSLPSIILYAPSYVLYQDLKLEQRSPMLLHMMHSMCLQQHRYQWSIEATIFIINEAIGKAFLILVVGSWLTHFAVEPTIIFVVVLVAAMMIYQPYHAAVNDMKIRKRSMLMELPKLLTQITLLVGAGETVQQAFMKCNRGKQDSKHPLYIEWHEATSELSNGASFSQIVEKLNRNCALQQMSLLTTILLLNYRKGGEHFVSAVQELNLSLWETRKTTAKIKGEEASSKMVFPLVGILFLLMILIVAPAIMTMNFM